MKPRPMEFGIFAKTFVRDNVEAVLDAVAASGVSSVQFNFSCCGLPTIPDAIPGSAIRNLEEALSARKLRMSALSATFNLIHPDPHVREEGLRRLPVLAAAAADLGHPLLTLCSGTRDPVDMWRHHPDNASAAAWQDLRRSLETALNATERWGVCLGIEPEATNTVSNARLCRRLLDEMGSRRLRVILDPANLMHDAKAGEERRIVEEAFDLLGPDVALGHAKELNDQGVPDGRGAGEGIIDWRHYLGQLRRVGFDGDVILHGLDEARVPAAVRHLRQCGQP